MALFMAQEHGGDPGHGKVAVPFRHWERPLVRREMGEGDGLWPRWGRVVHLLPGAGADGALLWSKGGA